jgi:homoserine kinase
LLADEAVAPRLGGSSSHSSVAVASSAEFPSRLPDWRLPGPLPLAGAAFRLTVPYSIGNVGPGFDRFGLCLSEPRDILDVAPSDAFRFEVLGNRDIPRRAEENAAGAAFLALVRGAEASLPVAVRLRKGFRGGSGLGSSGASAVAGALAAALALGWRLEAPEEVRAIAEAAAEGEAVACGAGHLDNSLASLFGGFTFLEQREPLSVLGLRPSLPMKVVLAVPEVALSTRTSRGVLPSSVPREDAVENLTRAAALLHALLRGDGPRIGANLEDRIATPYRTPLVPGFEEARAAGRAAGAWGVALSGSGPATFALTPPERAHRVAVALLEGFKRAGVLAEAFVTGIGSGAELSDPPAPRGPT